MFEETDSNNRKNNPSHWVHLDGLEKFLFFISVPFGLTGFIVLLFFYDELDKTIQIFMFPFSILCFLLFSVQPILKLQNKSVDFIWKIALITGVPLFVYAFLNS